MTEHERDELEEARHQELVEHLREMKGSVEGMRSQNSAEHGSIITKLLHVAEIAHWLKVRWAKFMNNE